MKKIILALLPQKWIDEIYFHGYKDAGSRVVDASYWFVSSPVLYDTLKQVGKNLSEGCGSGVNEVREDIYKHYPDVIKYKGDKILNKI